ncbi:MAG: imidazoleglycerol-phosphate dehydratase HisB [Candidatus Izimaplasma sp.]|nr:imidazoleglycerol-phosphate dehydratase HisB [Candidatus Izimaplasma bacterium]
MRNSNMTRTTNETSITASLNLDGNKNITIKTGIPFFDHMLTTFAFYAGFDLNIDASGDLDVDDHHTVEDVGIVLGKLINEALEDKHGIIRFATTLTPMDEALAEIALDISNRPVFIYNVNYTKEAIGGLSLENIKEFLYALVIESRVTCHVNLRYGLNDHHKVEAIFKGLGRAFKEAISVIDNQSITSTKGVL